jgi:hypothetical protein
MKRPSSVERKNQFEGCLTAAIAAQGLDMPTSSKRNKINECLTAAIAAQGLDMPTSSKGNKINGRVPHGSDRGSRT